MKQCPNSKDWGFFLYEINIHILSSYIADCSRFKETLYEPTVFPESK